MVKDIQRMVKHYCVPVCQSSRSVTYLVLVTSRVNVPFIFMGKQAGVTGDQTKGSNQYKLNQ